MIAGAGLRTSAVSLLAALLVAGHGCSRDEAKPPSEDVREIFSLSGVSLRFEAVREFLGTQLEMQRANWTPRQLAVAKRVIDERFSEEELSRRILDRLEASRDPRFTVEVVEWLRTPEARHIHQTPTIMTTTQSAAALGVFMRAKDRSPPSQERLALIERYDRATRRSRDSRQSLLFATFGVGLMTDALAPPGERAGAAAVRKSVEPKSELLTPIFEELSAITLLFAFQNLTDAEVGAVVEHSESEPVRWYCEALSKAYLDTLEEISSDLGNAFATALEAQSDS